jgi:RNA polymerase sigma-54 factor
MSLDMRVSQRLEQRQVLSLQTIQSLNILQMATTDLQQLVSEEMLQNPTLESDGPEGEGGAEAEAAAPVAAAEADFDRESPEPRTEVGETYEEVHEFLQRFVESEDTAPGRSHARNDGDADGKQEALQNSAAPGECLADHLLEQLRLADTPEAEWPLLEQIVYSLDSRGYLAYPLEDVVRSLDGRCTQEQAHAALAKVQALEPRGVGARSLAECLLLQVGTEDPDYEKFRQILTVHWQDVLRNKLPQVARAMKVSLEEIKALLEMLGTLNPHPGALYSEVPSQVVTPDVIVELDDNSQWRVRVTGQHMPRLAISHSYLRMLERKEGDRETLQFIKSKITAARALLDAIGQRQSTIERVARAIVKRQEDYLRYGVSGLRPMKMQDIADELSIHHSTVWRAVYGKYMQMPHGIVAMNTLFTGGLPRDEGDHSREAVKLKVKEIIDGEEKRKPLSDLAITQRLKQDGIHASRRVVTKYREELGLPDSRVRRRH